MNTEALKIIYNALDNLKNVPYISSSIKYSVEEAEPIKIKIDIKNRPLEYHIITRSELRANQVPILLNEQPSTSTLIIAEKIGNEAKELLVANETSYIDLTGNIYLIAENMMILLDAKKTSRKVISKPSRAFTKTGLKVVFHFLVNESFLRMSYRQIAKETGTSLGNVTNVINALSDLGYLEKTYDEIYNLKNKEQLLRKWIDAYDHTLKPSLEVGRFSFINEDDFQNWRRTRLEDKITVWGAAPGTFLMLGRPAPSQLTIYTNESRDEFMRNYRLKLDPDGDVLVYRKFWTYSDLKINVAPTILLYTDLINSSLEKNHKAAEVLYDDVLKSKLLAGSSI